MALWQYTFYVLPNGKQSNLLSILRLKRDEDYFDDSQFWERRQAKASLFEKVSDILPKNKSWSNDIVLYRNQDSNCLEVFCEDTIVASVSFRIDFRSQYDAILDRLIDFLRSNELLIVDEELRLLPYNLAEIKKVIERSPQFHMYKKLSKP